jgi:indole-3-glycerol phosphate synthase/phosphoribosylanthranilate isomerase
MSILERIVERRRERVRGQGHSLGVPLPEERRVPILPFGRDPFLICEVKRRSPSRGWIAQGLDAALQARVYRRRGVVNVSVLTEEDHFGGSLRDLMEIKAAVPDAAVLRKDFLLDEEDIIVSHRAGADAVLLIAALLSARELAALHQKARELGMEALVEVHDAEDCAKARSLGPTLTGINCRDLRSFTTDILLPVRMKKLIDWPTRLVFESGIRWQEDALLALSSGFKGILAGESVIRDENVLDDLLKAFGRKAGGFWPKLFERQRPGRPLVKICGITREEDARLAEGLGADILGFVLASSPRRADPGLLARLRDVEIPKVAVTAGPGKEGGAAEAARLQEEGLIDAVQLHGEESPEECLAAAFPYYKTVRLRSREEVERISRFRCPRVLVDAHSPHALGGTGRRIPEDLVGEVKKKHPLWLAGGLGPGNIREVLDRFHPELVDASSGLESTPGIKDPDRMKTYFKEIGRDNQE